MRLPPLAVSRIDLLKMPSPSWGRRLGEMLARDLLFRWRYLVRIELRPPTRVQINRTMTAPMTEPMIPEGWRKPSVASLWKIRYPRNPPTNEPMTPRTMVIAIDKCCLPGTSNRASAPATSPTMTIVTMSPSMVSDFLDLAPRGRSEIGPVERLPDADTVHHPYGGFKYTPREVILGDDLARERSDHRGDRRRLRRGGDGLGQHVRSVQRPRGCRRARLETRLSSTPST